MAYIAQIGHIWCIFQHTVIGPVLLRTLDASTKEDAERALAVYPRSTG